MSTEPRTRDVGESPEPPRSLDLTGLPAPVADELRRLVAALRGTLAAPPGPRADAAAEPADRWAQRLQEWIDSHPFRVVSLDDDREGLYTGRGG